MKINQNSSHEMKWSSGDLVPYPFSSGSTIDVQTFNDSEFFYDAEDSQNESEEEENEEETDQTHIEHGEFENDQSQKIRVDHNLMNDQNVSVQEENGRSDEIKVSSRRNKGQKPELLGDFVTYSSRVDFEPKTLKQAMSCVDADK
ncbi:hypothetical protein ACKWTF_012932 [Chironomus riparius]